MILNPRVSVLTHHLQQVVEIDSPRAREASALIRPRAVRSIYLRSHCSFCKSREDSRKASARRGGRQVNRKWEIKAGVCSYGAKESASCGRSRKSHAGLDLERVQERYLHAKRKYRHRRCHCHAEACTYFARRSETKARSTVCARLPKRMQGCRRGYRESRKCGVDAAEARGGQGRIHVRLLILPKVGVACRPTDWRAAKICWV